MNGLSELEAIFFAALDKRSAQERVAYLEMACSGDSSLRQRVEKMLDAQSDARSFLESPPSAIAPNPQQTTELLAEHIGSAIGRYKLLEQIGEGGMGVVFVAEQTEPVRRRVALKIIKPGMDTKQVIARFEAERQALAMMDHPNIAKIFDAGTTGGEVRNAEFGMRSEENSAAIPHSALRTPHSVTGRPYFVMELVRGMPITEYCDKARLSPRQRLELFADVCHAVQHAHQKGLIHRDLKPSNVLVTLHDGTPIVKVIDFGVAKAVGQQLTERTIYTALTQLVGTPLYMSPEQAEMSGLDVDTRSDVYSLGVLLYELLTGHTPFDKERMKSAGFDEMRRIIREEEPPRPSHRISTLNAQASSTISLQRGLDERHLSRVLRGELDWIVMKSLEKDRSRRYESASALASDIQRYLSDEPVLACPPTTMYRFQKLARKHQPALITAAAIALCLLLGTTVSAWQAVRATTAEAQANANEQKATTERDEAQRQRDEVKALNDKLVAKDQQLQRTLYAANMTLANRAWDEANVPRALELLDQSRPKPGEIDLRGFEWHYVHRLCRSELLTLRHMGQPNSAHNGLINSVAYSPDGKRLASASYDDTAKVWDVQTGRELLTLNGACFSVTFSPDGKRLASGSRDNTVKVWDVQSGQEIVAFMGHTQGVKSVAFSPDGMRLASGSWDNTVKVWDASTGQNLLSLKGHNSDVWTVAFSPDGKRLASMDDTVKVWDAQTGQQLVSIKGGGWFVAFSPDSKRLATADGNSDHAVKVWDVETGKELLIIKAPHAGTQVNSVAFSPDGKRLASAGGDRTVKMWNSETGQELTTFKGHVRMAWDVAFSPDGTRLASAASDGTVRVWDATTIPGTPTIRGLTRPITSIAFSPDGKRLSFGTRTSDENMQASMQLKVLDVPTGQELLSIKGHTHPVASLAFSADGKRMAGSTDTTVKVWNAQTGRELLTLIGHRNRVTRVVFSPDGKRLASADMRGSSGNREEKVWDAETGQELFAIKDAGGSVTFSPDGKRVASTVRGSTIVWDAATGQELLSLPGQGRASGVAFSPDGKRLASSSNFGPPSGIGEITVRDSQTGEVLLSLKGHSASITSIAFSPDGKRLASASGNPGIGGQSGEVKLWDALTAHELLNLKIGPVGHIAFSPSGQWLVVVDAGGTLKRIYDATPLPEKP